MVSAVAIHVVEEEEGSCFQGVVQVQYIVKLIIYITALEFATVLARLC